MLESSTGMVFLPSEDLTRSAHFFGGVLDLPLVSQSPFALAFSCGDTPLRVTKVDNLRPQPFTVFGWRVLDLRATVEWLHGRGVNLLRFDGVQHAEQGMWRLRRAAIGWRGSQTRT